MDSRSVLNVAMPLTLCGAINSYSCFLENEITDDDQKQEMQLRAANAEKILNIGCGFINRLSADQVDLLRNFSNTYCQKHPDDKVVQLASYVANLYFISNLSLLFYDIPTFCRLPKKTQMRVTSHAIHRLMNDGTNGEKINFENLHRFIEIAILSTKEQSNKFFINNFVDRIGHLIKHPECPDKFKILSTAAVKSVEDTIIPQEISSCIYFHGGILSEGYSELIKRLKEFKTHISDKNQEPQISALAFVDKYCRDKLHPKQYLIRNSTTAMPATTPTGSLFVVTMTAKTVTGELFHQRIFRYQMGNGYYWKVGNATDVYTTLHQLFYRLRETQLQGYWPLTRPNTMEMRAYIDHGYIMNR
jgi:hypothetical protein